jgi:hypothetical protein
MSVSDIAGSIEGTPAFFGVQQRMYVSGIMPQAR